METGARSRTRLSLAVHGEQYLTELRNHGRRPRTLKAYHERLRWFWEWAVSVDLALEDVTRDAIEQWLSDLTERGISPKHRQNLLSAVKCFFAWLADLDYIPKNPLARIPAIHVPKRLPRPLAVEEVMRLIGAAQTPRERVIVVLLYVLGCRKEELLSINVDDLDLSGGNVWLFGKGAKERPQPINAIAAEVVRAWLPVRATILKPPTPGKGLHGDLRALLVTREGRMSPQTLLDVVHRLADRAGLDKRVYPHLFRHSFATHLLEGGASIEEVQKLLNHASIATTMVYTKVANRRVREAHARALPELPAGLLWRSIEE